MSGDPYIKENEELRAEIDRLQESVNYLQIADNHHQELMAEKEEEIAKLRAALEELQIELKKEEKFTKALQNELKREEKFTIAAMDKAKVYQAALEEIAQGKPYPSHCAGIDCKRMAREALAKEEK